MNPLQEHWFLDLGDPNHYIRVCLRLTVAAVLGGFVGFEREEERRRAGLRTHVLVAMGAALFVLGAVETGVELSGLMRIIQGLTAGIGFLGAGVILKLPDERRIEGLTTAASLWVTAAIGTATAMGLVWPAVYTVLLAYLVLLVLKVLEWWMKSRPRH